MIFQKKKLENNFLHYQKNDLDATKNSIKAVIYYIVVTNMYE